MPKNWSITATARYAEDGSVVEVTVDENDVPAGEVELERGDEKIICALDFEPSERLRLLSEAFDTELHLSELVVAAVEFGRRFEREHPDKKIGFAP